MKVPPSRALAMDLHDPQARVTWRAQWVRRSWLIAAYTGPQSHPLVFCSWGMVCHWVGLPRTRRAWTLAKRLLYLFLVALVRRAQLEGRIEGRGEPEYQFRAGPFRLYRPNAYRSAWFGARRRSLRRRARRQVLKGGLGRFWLRV